MMLFDVQAALAEILNEPPARCDSRDSCDFTRPESQQSRESQSQPAEIAAPAKVLPFAAPSTPAQSRQDGEPFSHGHCRITGRPRTWTGRVVSLDEWRRLSAWDRHGSTGQLWNGITRQWEPDGGAA